MSTYQQVSNLAKEMLEGQTVLKRRKAGEELSLTGAEFGVLQCLMENVGELVDKDSLSIAALGRPLMAYDRSIDMHVSNLRKKLGRRTDDSDWIKTVRSRGYMLAI